MSTGLNCELIEYPAGSHYYILEDGSAPKNAWDWHEYAEAYGPFKSEDEACDHLGKHHANPGGSYNPGLINIDKGLYRELIARAPANMARFDPSIASYWGRLR